MSQQQQVQQAQKATVGDTTTTKERLLSLTQFLFDKDVGWHDIDEDFLESMLGAPAAWLGNMRIGAMVKRVDEIKDDEINKLPLRSQRKYQNGRIKAVVDWFDALGNLQQKVASKPKNTKQYLKTARNAADRSVNKLTSLKSNLVTAVTIAEKRAAEKAKKAAEKAAKPAKNTRKQPETDENTQAAPAPKKAKKSASKPSFGWCDVKNYKVGDTVESPNGLTFTVVKYQNRKSWAPPAKEVYNEYVTPCTRLDSESEVGTIKKIEGKSYKLVSRY